MYIDLVTCSSYKYQVLFLTKLVHLYFTLCEFWSLSCLLLFSPTLIKHHRPKENINVINFHDASKRCAWNAILTFTPTRPNNKWVDGYQIKARPTMDSNIVHKVWSLMKGPDPLTFTGASNIEIIYMFTPVECFVVIWFYSLFLVFPTCKTRVFYQFSSKIAKHLVVWLFCG